MAFLDDTGVMKLTSYLKTKIKTMLETKQDTLVSGSNISTINGRSLLMPGNYIISTPPHECNYIYSAVSSTEASNADKVLTISAFDFSIAKSGSILSVKFTNANTYSGQIRLGIGSYYSTIYVNDEITSATNPVAWDAGETITFLLWDTDGAKAWIIGRSKGTASSSSTDIVATNISIAANDWASDATYSSYPYKATIAMSGVTSSMLSEVIFSPDDAASGNYAAVSATGTNSVYIYAKQAGAVAITIPTVVVYGDISVVSATGVSF